MEKDPTTTVNCKTILIRKEKHNILKVHLQGTLQQNFLCLQNILTATFS